MKKDDIKLISGIIVGVIVAFYAGAMFNFFPFVGDDLVTREIGFCTLIICVVIGVCTIVIKNKDKEEE